jgi:hypothetical protein
MADDPVIAAAMNLMIAMIRFPAMAATTAIFELLCVAKEFLPLFGGSGQFTYLSAIPGS